MNLIVISPPDTFSGEIDILSQLFYSGLYRYHLRKSKWEKQRVKEHLEKIPSSFYPRIVLHGDLALTKGFPLSGFHLKENQPTPPAIPSKNLSRSFHTLEALHNSSNPLNYAFLSPIFDSISKPGHAAAFSHQSLERFLKNRSPNTPSLIKVIALGGILPHHVPVCRRLGFDGVAVLGGIWDSDNPLCVFHSYQKAINEHQQAQNTP